jgi:type I restriction enzyme S subunit
MSKLGEYLTVKHGWAFKGEFFSETGSQSILTPGNFYEKGGFKYNSEKERYYTGDYPQEYLCKRGDLIVAMTEQAAGLLGSTAIVPEDNRYLHNQRVGLIICDEKKLLPLYAYYLFMTQSVREQIARSSSGTKVKHTSPEKIYDVIVRIPNTDTQRKVSMLLWAIDSKIHINDLLSAELESMAKTLYDYWFTQFDFPDENGKPYRTSGGEMEWNDQLKREIPKGWEVGNLYSIANPINGLACQKYRPKDGENSLPVVKIKEMHEGITSDTERVSTNIPGKHRIVDGDILFSWSATLEVMYWFGGDAGLNQHIFKVVPINRYSKEFVYHQFSAYVINFVKMAEARKTTMGHITTDHLEQSRIALPPKGVIDQFTEIIAPIHEKIGQCQKENRELTKLRDWLLPMLMNGQAVVE